MTINDLKTPALLLDVEILEKNLQEMQSKANRLGVNLRPHIKTHKCIQIAKRQIELGAKGITVSTFYEAQKFAEAGFKDITWAFPAPECYLEDAVRLSEKITLRILLDNLHTFEKVEIKCKELNQNIHVWLEIDCGQHRSGVDPKSKYAEDLLRKLIDSKYLIFDGILTHAGHSYSAANKEEIYKIADDEKSVMLEFTERMRDKGISIPAISIGSTPTMAVAENLYGITEIRPGNYVFYDFSQVLLGSCKTENCTLTVLSSVISHQPGANHFIIDGGALTFSKDAGPRQIGNYSEYGMIFDDYSEKMLNNFLKIQTLTQEHGKVLKLNQEPDKLKYEIGTKLRILENHSCLTAVLFDKYYLVQKNNVVGEWEILRGR